MSTNRNCEFFENEPQRWYYLLEHEGYEDAWDWREDAGCYGPFAELAEARAHLSANHANPGGFYVSPYDPARPEDETTRALVERAIDPARSRRF